MALLQRPGAAAFRSLELHTGCAEKTLGGLIFFKKKNIYGDGELSHRYPGIDWPRQKTQDVSPLSANALKIAAAPCSARFLSGRTTGKNFHDHYGTKALSFAGFVFSLQASTRMCLLHFVRCGRPLDCSKLA